MLIEKNKIIKIKKVSYSKNPITNENSFFIAYKNAIIIIGGNLIEALEDWKLIKVKEPAKKRSISCKFKV